jgi:hypothetical protein
MSVIGLIISNMQTGTIIKEVNLFLRSKECNLKENYHLPFLCYIITIINFVSPIVLSERVFEPYFNIQ